jgi:phosphocarrier protein HPr
MIEKKTNLSHTTIIKNTLGIHARPAAKISQIVENAKQSVWISTKNNKVDAGSIIDILSLGASLGTTVVIEIETSEDIDILKSISNLIDSLFGEGK